MAKAIYDRFPKITVETAHVWSGFDDICAQIAATCAGRAKTVVTIECYPGVDQQELLQGMRGLSPCITIHSDSLAFEPEKIDALLEQDLTEDPVFGIMTVRRLNDFFYLDKISQAQQQIAAAKGTVLIYGVGASLVHPGDIQIMADITRWEI